MAAWLLPGLPLLLGLSVVEQLLVLLPAAGSAVAVAAALVVEALLLDAAECSAAAAGVLLVVSVAAPAGVAELQEPGLQLPGGLQEQQVRQYLPVKAVNGERSRFVQVRETVPGGVELTARSTDR